MFTNRQILYKQGRLKVYQKRVIDAKDIIYAYIIWKKMPTSLHIYQFNFLIPWQFFCIIHYEAEVELYEMNASG